MTAEVSEKKLAASKGLRFAIASGIAAWFLLVSWDAVTANFAPDEMFAIWWYWHTPPWHQITSQFLLWKGYLRPLGALFYLPVYGGFGLNPVPYHVYLLALLLLGAFLMYRLARVLGAGDLPCVVVALVACYHGGLSNLYYNSVFVFDVLVGICYFAVVTYYARIRSSGRLLNGVQTAVFLLLYLCTLNAKEMAVTLPVMLLAYEWLFHGGPPWRPREFAAWLWGPGRALIWTGLMNLLFLYGKRFGPEGLMNGPSDAYRPALRWDRFVDFNERYIGDLFYHLPRFDWPATLIIWLAVTWFAWRGRNPLLRFCWIWIVVTPLPIEWIIGRDQACLYVCMAGWAILAGVAFRNLVALAAPLLVKIDAGCRRVGVEKTRTRIAVAGLLVYAVGAWQYKVAEVKGGMPALGAQTMEVLAEFRAHNPSVPPGSTVVFLNDPWPNHGFDMAFIASLWFRDRKAQVFLNQSTHLSDAEIAKAQAVFTWEEGKLIRVR